MKLLFTASAIMDLERLRAFIAEKNPAAAEKMKASLLESLGILLDIHRLALH